MKKIKIVILLIIISALSACSSATDKTENETDNVNAESIESKEIANTETAEIVDTQNLETEIETKEIVKVDNIKSEFDFNNNGIDDYSDFVIGAKKDAQKHPRYNPAYVSKNNGYPDDNNGVCTDVIWRAFREAGYSLRTMLNNDIDRRRGAYTNIQNEPDPYIDFRRVKTLKPFFEQYSENLELEMTDPKNWQPGDIITFDPRDFHIGILSDNRNEDGYPLVIHNMGQNEREEDYLPRKINEITGHYRFNAKNIPNEILSEWQEGENLD